MTKYTTDKVPSPTYRHNELKAELLSVGAVNPFAGYNSSPRQAMLVKQLGQVLVVDGAEPRALQTGIEREIAKTTFSKRFDSNSYIIATVPKYIKQLGKDAISKTPMTAIIYENSDSPTNEVDIMYVQDYFNMHHFFGFEYKHNSQVMSKIKPGSRIPAGTIVSDSPAVMPNGDYCYGVNANVLMCSHPAGSEDGLVISESFAKKNTTTLYEVREFQFGDDMIPLNAYGDKDSYRIFPDIGEKVRADGILCALRDYQEELSPCDLSVKAVQRITEFDKKIYVPPDSEVVDITVTQGAKQSKVIFTQMEDQVEKYHLAHLQYYSELRRIYRKLKAESHGKLSISKEFHRVLVEAEAFLDRDKKPNSEIKLTRKRKYLPRWTVKIVVKYKRQADIGFKFTDTHGGKSVTVDVWPDDRMPVDALGNVADIIVDDNSTIKRLIKGKIHEHYLNASRRDTLHRIRKMVEAYGNNIPDEVYDEVWEYLLGFYKIASPVFYEMIGEIKPDIKHHIDTILADNCIYVYMPTDSPVNYLEVNKLLMEYYPAQCGPITMKNYRGETITTHGDFVIGNIYYMLLEKIANDASAVSSARLQHFGLPSKPSNNNKHDSPIKMSPVRFGESEYRLFVATAGGVATAELADRSANIRVHREIIRNLLNADKPTDVDNLVDRSKFPIGGGFMQDIIRHEFNMIGLDIQASGENNE